jgi:hypothetical protein
MKGEIEVPEMSADLLIVVIVFIILVGIALKIIGAI